MAIVEPSSASRAAAAVAFVLLVLPWINPFAPGPSAAIAPLMFAWFCGALALGCGVWRRPVLVAGAWLVAASLGAVFGLLQYFGATEWAGGLINYTEPGTAYGNLRQRNQFATLLSIGVLAALYLAASGRGLRWVLPLLVLMAISSAASTSRTGLLQIAVIAVVSLWWTGADHRRIVLRLCGVVLGAYALAAVSLPPAFGALTGQEAPTLWGRVASGPGCASRMVLWSNVLDLIIERPWTGWGVAELDYAHFAHLYLGPRFCDILDNAHNLPLHVAVELGLPLAAALIAAIAWLVARAAPWRERDPVRQLAWGVILMLALHSLVEYPLWYGPFQLALVLSGLMLAPQRVPAPAWSAAGRWLAFGAAPLALAFVAWDYHRVMQLYLEPEQRAPAYREATLEQASGSVLFARQVRFAELSVTSLTRANAAAYHALALDMLHFSPEPKVIEAVIDSAMVLHDEDAARWHMLRYKAAFPVEYATWLERATGLPRPGT